MKFISTVLALVFAFASVAVASPTPANAFIVKREPVAEAAVNVVGRSDGGNSGNHDW